MNFTSFKKVSVIDTLSRVFTKMFGGSPFWSLMLSTIYVSTISSYSWVEMTS